MPCNCEEVLANGTQHTNGCQIGRGERHHPHRKLFDNDDAFDPPAVENSSFDPPAMGDSSFDPPAVGDAPRESVRWFIGLLFGGDLLIMLKLLIRIRIRKIIKY